MSIEAVALHREIEDNVDARDMELRKMTRRELLELARCCENLAMAARREAMAR